MFFLGSTELDSSAAEADIKRLFGQLEEPAVIVLSSDGEASERHKGLYQVAISENSLCEFSNLYWGGGGALCHPGPFKFGCTSLLWAK